MIKRKIHPCLCLLGHLIKSDVIPCEEALAIYDEERALVAQRIEQKVSNLQVAGSSPA